MITRFAFLVRLSLALGLMLSASCAPAARPPAPQQPAQPAQPGPVSPTQPPASSTVQLRVVFEAMNNMQLLTEAFNRAADVVSIASSTKVSIVFLPMAMATGYCSTIAPFMDQYPDILLLDGASALQVYAAQTFTPAPPELAQGIFEPGLQAFTYQGELLAVPQATRPLMIIYNPKQIGNLPTSISLEQLYQMTEKYPMVIPPHPAIAVAAIQSVLGAKFDEKILQAPDFAEKMMGLNQPVNDFLQNKRIRILDQNEDLPGLIGNKAIAWTISPSEFLRQLSQGKYDGQVDVRPLPTYNGNPGTAAMGVGWAVPASSENTQLAWQVISQLVQDPKVTRAFLENGMLPISERGFQQIQDSTELAQLLPPGDYLPRLKDIAAQSVIWRVPTSVPMSAYNKTILPDGTDLFRKMVKGDLTYSDAFAQWKSLLDNQKLLIP